MNVAEGIRRIAVAIRFLGWLWFAGWALGATANVFAAENFLKAFPTSEASYAAQLNDDRIMQLLTKRAAEPPDTPPPESWIEKSKRSILLLLIGIVGLLLARAFAWVLEGFASANP